MRLWSLHPSYLDPQGLVAVWREGLLAQAVLRGQTTGYTRHPQLARFRGAGALGAMAAYLREMPNAHPLFRVVRGGVADWERLSLLNTAAGRQSD